MKGNNKQEFMEDDDPFLNQTEKKEKPVKIMHPLTENEISEYTQVYYRYLDKDGIPNKSPENQVVPIFNLEDMMRETPFKLHDDPEEVMKQEALIDPLNYGSISLEMWLKHMEFKTNYIEEDLI